MLDEFFGAAIGCVHECLHNIPFQTAFTHRLWVGSCGRFPSLRSRRQGPHRVLPNLSSGCLTQFVANPQRMAAASETAANVKRVQVDPSTFALGSAGNRRGSSRRNKRSSQGGSAKPTLRNSVSQVDIAAQSAALQAAVEQALATAGSAGRQPSLTASPSVSNGDAPKPPSQETKTVSTMLIDPTNSAVSPSHPRSATSVSTAVQELNRLMEERARSRIRKTVRAQQHRGGAATATATATATAPAPAPQSNGDGRPPTPLVGGSTAARLPNAPPWGCLKGGNQLTLRKFRKTQRAARQSTTSAPPLASEPKRHVRVKPTQPEVSTPAPGDVVTVGRQRSGKVAFVIGNTTRSSKHPKAGKSGRRSVTNRARLRRAHLLRGGSNTPQRLIEEMARSIEVIGEVERPMPS